MVTGPQEEPAEEVPTGEQPQQEAPAPEEEAQAGEVPQPMAGMSAVDLAEEILREQEDTGRTEEQEVDD